MLNQGGERAAARPGGRGEGGGGNGEGVAARGLGVAWALSGSECAQQGRGEGRGGDHQAMQARHSSEQCQTFR